MEIICIRHLPTTWNDENRLQGSKDIDIKPSTEKDERKILENLQYINQLSPIQEVYTSMLKRTEQTALKYGFKHTIRNPLLNELNFGEFEGKLKKDFHAIHEREWLDNPRALVLGESMLAFEERILEFLSMCKNLDRALVFTHGAWIRGLLSIKKYGDINSMNTFVVNNNELIIIHI